MSKFIIITGGVVSSLGKGISGASIGKLLQFRKKYRNIFCFIVTGDDYGHGTHYFSFCIVGLKIQISSA